MKRTSHPLLRLVLVLAAAIILVPVAVLSSATMAESEMLLHSSAGKLAEPNSSSCTVRRV